MDNKILTTVVITLIVAGLGGFYIGRANQPFSNSYMQGSASMMKENGTTMTQMGQMMMGGGKMMKEKGTQYNDTDMMQQGKEWETKGQMMNDKGTEMMGRGNGMMDMMK
ncbi:MAG: hypothetical protein HYV32_05915 [Candidatus Kerfeldbacteria bacterium]|nr:hypothetical protein [Candidatus Kerfeldbacteria bacterium]